MKKLLLATSALVASAGFASADVTMSGAAVAGYLDGGDNSNVYDGNGAISGGPTAPGVYSNAQVTFVLTGTSDNGIEFGSAITARVHDTRRKDFHYVTPTTGSDNAAVWIAAGGFRVDIERDDIADYYDADNNATGDVRVSYKSGGITAGLTWNVDDQDGVYSKPGLYSDFSLDGSDYFYAANSYFLGYEQGGIALSIAGNNADETGGTANDPDGNGQDGQMVAAVSYSTDVFSVGLELDDDGTNNDDGTDQTTTVMASYNFGSGSVGVEVSDDSVDVETTVTLSIASGPVSVATEYVAKDNGADDEWKVEGSYNAGGGLVFNAGFNWEDAMYIETAMKF